MYIFCCSIIIRSQGLDNCRECPILPRHQPSCLSRPGYWEGNHGARAANRTRTGRRRSSQGLHLHVVGMCGCLSNPPWAGVRLYLVYPLGDCHAHRGHRLGWTYWVPAVPSPPPWAWVPPAPLSPTFPLFCTTCITSSPAPWNFSLSWVARQAALKSVCELPPCSRN